ncbi:hypothetical protein IFM47457_11058 [Aspergillus lentulus]|nr:hypothetical protein IFM47457_11058 [Aspergillus lentulus]
MSQGVICAVNVAPEYGHRMGFADEHGKVIKPSLQGGIAAMCYLGALFGAFWAGSFSDAYERIKGIWLACAWRLVGAILQTSAVNLAHMLCARVVAGVGVSFIIVIAPSWTAELTPAAHRGQMIALTFLANFGGIALSSWIGFATSFTDDAGGAFRWRFCFACQVFPIIFLVIGTLLIPKSPRWLVKVGRNQEAFEIITKLGEDGLLDHPNESQKSSYIKMLLGIGSGDIHIGRRIHLVFWLQVLMQYDMGIAAVVIYSGNIYRTAGFDDFKSNWLPAVCMTCGVLRTGIAALTLD